MAVGLWQLPLSIVWVVITVNGQQRPQLALNCMFCFAADVYAVAVCEVGSILWSCLWCLGLDCLSPMKSEQESVPAIFSTNSIKSKVLFSNLHVRNVHLVFRNNNSEIQVRSETLLFHDSWHNFIVENVHTTSINLCLWSESCCAFLRCITLAALWCAFWQVNYSATAFLACVLISIFCIYIGCFAAPHGPGTPWVNSTCCVCSHCHGTSSMYSAQQHFVPFCEQQKV